MTAIDQEQARRILDLPLPANDANAATVRDYLLELLATVWEEGEGFSSKRPFGNSGWEYELYTPLIKAGLIEGSLDEDGYVDRLDTRRADEVIVAAIRSMGGH